MNYKFLPVCRTIKLSNQDNWQLRLYKSQVFLKTSLYDGLKNSIFKLKLTWDVLVTLLILDHIEYKISRAQLLSNNITFIRSITLNSYALCLHYLTCCKIHLLLNRTTLMIWHSYNHLSIEKFCLKTSTVKTFHNKIFQKLKVPSLQSKKTR